MKTKLLITSILLVSIGAFAQTEKTKKENQKESPLFNKTTTRGTEKTQTPSKVDDAKLFAAKKGTFIDPRDNKNYRWVKINGQIWMADNLAYMPKVYSPNEKDGGYWVYDYNSQNIEQALQNINYKTFGVLYNYNTASRACPPGWRLPMDYDWRKLEASLGISKDNLMKKGSRGINSEFIKSDRAWDAIGGEVNKFGFSAVPSGFYNAKYKKFQELGRTSIYWSLEVSDKTIWCRALHNKNDKIERTNSDLDYGYSVRCIKE